MPPQMGGLETRANSRGRSEGRSSKVLAGGARPARGMANGAFGAVEARCASGDGAAGGPVRLASRSAGGTPQGLLEGGASASRTWGSQGFGLGPRPSGRVRLSKPSWRPIRNSNGRGSANARQYREGSSSDWPVLRSEVGDDNRGRHTVLEVSHDARSPSVHLRGSSK